MAFICNKKKENCNKQITKMSYKSKKHGANDMYKQ